MPMRLVSQAHVFDEEPRHGEYGAIFAVPGSVALISLTPDDLENIRARRGSKDLSRKIGPQSGCWHD